MGSKDVYIVEDQGIIARELQENIATLGYDVPFKTSSGEEVIQTIEQDPPHLTITDINLSGSIDGIETARKIREVQPDVPVLFVTAMIEDEIVDRVPDTNTVGIVKKPFNEGELQQVVEWVLEENNQPPEINCGRIFQSWQD
ncbi:MAG: response regulator [bacterium]